MKTRNWTRAAVLVLGAGLTCAPASVAGGSDAAFVGAANAVSAAAVSGSQAQRAIAQVPAPAPVPAPVESVVRDETTDVDVELNAATVKCSVSGYSAAMLKILVPALADLTVLDHRNISEGAPCIAAGRCDGNLGPQNILQSGDGTDVIPVRVVLKKTAQLEGAVCRVFLVETVTTQVRGVPFFHERRQEVASRKAEDCR